MVSFRKLLYSLALAATLILCAAPSAFAKRPVKDRIDSLYISRNWRFTLDVFADLYFDNKEFDSSGGKYVPSGTILNSQMIPVIGFTHENPSGSETSIQIGANLNLFHGREFRPTVSIPMFITHKYKAFTGHFGFIPAKYFSGEHHRALYSDDYFFDTNGIKGAALSWTKEKFDYRLGINWEGAFGPANQRERFYIYSFGEHELKPWVSLGYDLYYYHLACSEEIIGVVDNAIAYPHVTFRPLRNDWKFDIQLGWLQALQRDRTRDEAFKAPGGGYLELNFGWKGIFLKNGAYYGQGLMPYYNSTDSQGTPYKALLYIGDPLYSFEGTKLYDCISVGYKREIIPGMTVMAQINFHFHTGNDKPFTGTNQLFSFVFDGRIFK